VIPAFDQEKVIPMSEKPRYTISRLLGYPRLMAWALTRLPKPFRAPIRRFHFRREINRVARRTPPPVLVYTAPKVASTAVTEAVRAIEGQAVYQVHMISAASMQNLRDGMRRRGLTRMKDDVLGLEDIAKAVASGLIGPRHPARIVSLVRDPVARNISFYFETLDLLWQIERPHERVPLERLLAEFHQRFTHERGIDWFDNEFKPVLGIDVYEHPFPHDKGYLRIDSGPYEVLLMRHDLNDRLKEKCLAELIGVPAVTLTPKNVGTQKSYANIYREFLNRIELPEDYVYGLLDSKYARHFYSPEERARFRSKWLKGTAPETTAPRASVSLAVSTS
jgi:Putative capsular polysaccharide synthesis protein